MNKPPTSRLARLGRIGALTSRVSGSYLAQRVISTIQDEAERKKALHKLHIDNAEKIVETMGLLKGAAMKLGQSIAQAASGMGLPDEVAGILGRLNASAEPVPFEMVVEDIEASCERPVSELYESLDPTPLGSASLGQVHRARLHDGTDAVVKVLYRDIEKSVASDLAALKTLMLAGSVLRRPREEVDALFDEVRERLVEEIDYLHEAENIRLFTEILGDDDRVRLPRVHTELSTKRVLVMDRLPGVPLAEFLESSSPQARQRAGETLGDTLFRMVYRHLLLHADPHPGNYLFEPDGRVGLLDFGCVKRFDPAWASTYARVGLCATNGDRAGCIHHARALGALTGQSAEAEEVLWELCALIGEPFAAGRYTLGGHADSLLERIAPVTRKMLQNPEIRAPRHLLYMNRALGGTYTILKKLIVRADWGAIYRSHAEIAAARPGIGES